jgi:hypothetical protein
LSTLLLTGMAGISLHMQWPLTSHSHGRFLKENNCFFVTDQTPCPYQTRSLPAQFNCLIVKINDPMLLSTVFTWCAHSRPLRNEKNGAKVVGSVIGGQVPGPRYVTFASQKRCCAERTYNASSALQRGPVQYYVCNLKSLRKSTHELSYYETKPIQLCFSAVVGT